MANTGVETNIKAPTGSELNCKGWHQEAALRMLMNNLDPEVAEKPDELIVYGGGGKAARNWESYHKIVETLKRLEDEHREFIDFLQKLREAKDKAEFDQFMEQRGDKPAN